MATKKKKDAFVDDWMTQIKAGLDYRKKYSTRDRWDDFRKYYRGQWAEGIVPVNKIFSYGRMLMPRVYFRAPRVTVTPPRPDLTWHAKVVEAIDNILIKEALLKWTLKMSTLDTYLCGVGPIKIGYDSEFGYIPEQAATEDGETATQVSTEEEFEKIEYNVGVRPGMPWAFRVRPEDVVVPWGATDAIALPWVAHYVLRPLDDVMQDQKYRNTKELKGTRTPSIEEQRRVEFRPRTQRDKGVVYAELWEVRDVKTKQIMVFCEDQMLMSTEDVLQIEGLPWEFIMFNPDPEYFWAIPDASILEPQQKELNATRSQASRHREIALLKFLYKQGAIEKEELAKFLSGQVGPAVAVKADVENLATAITTLQPHIPPDLYKEYSAIINDMREELGFSQNQEAAFSPYHGKTATETMTVAEAFESRIDERRDIVSDALVNIIRKWNQFIFAFWTKEKVVRIVTPQGEPFWIKYTGDELEADYFLSIDAESGMPITRALKYQMGKELIEIFGGDQLINQPLLRQIVLDNYTPVDPRVGQLMQTQFGGTPEILAAQRQPTPIGGPGKGAGGGRVGSSPERPMEFEEAKKRFAGGR